VQAAARRWGAELCEVTSLLGAHHPFAAKFRLHQFATVGTRCLYLDADMVIRSDTPSPFDLVPDGYWGAVRNHQIGMFDNHEHYQRPSWDIACSQLGVRQNYNVNRYVNGGFIMFDSSHVAQMKQLERCVTDVQGVNEQAAWGVMMDQAGTVYLPATWNRVGPAVWQASTMTDYIHHFACYLEYRQEGKAAKIAATKWSIP
jgi:hypothetical protein